MNFFSILERLMQQSGFAALSWQNAVMLFLSFVLLYLAIAKKFEPLLLLPIAFGMFLSNLPSAGTFSYFYEIDHWYNAGILGVMYMGVKSSFFPCMVFLAVGAMTDFGPLIANPVSLILGAAAQLALSPVTALWTDWTGAPLSALSLPENEAQWLLAVLALCVAPALCEEAFFRGGVLTGLTDAASRGTALALSTLLFALMHGSLAGLPAHLAISLLAGLCLLRWGMLRVCMLLHLGYNAMALLTPALPVSLGVSAPLGLLLAAAGLWMAGGIPWHGRHGRMGLPERLMCALAIVCAALAYLPELL